MIVLEPGPENVTIQFFPHMNFQDTVKLDYTITGLDLQAMDFTHGHHDFAFFCTDGNIEIIEATTSHANLPQNTISVHNAKLLHFSRYGWIRSQQ
jgi:hypothetical protein